MTTLSAVRSTPIDVGVEEIEVTEIIISNKLYLIDDKNNVYSVDTHDKIGTLNELEQAVAAENCDKVCKNIGRLPLELRHAIFNCLTIDFRLEMVLQKTAQIIRTLFEAYTERLLDITALRKVVDKAIRSHFFYRKEQTPWRSDYFIKQPFKKWLAPIEFKQMDIIVSTEHPVVKALREIVIIPRIYNHIDSTTRNRWPAKDALEALTKIVSTITKCCDILPTFTVHNDKQGRKFNYYVRKHTFHFICLLTKFISKLKVPLEERALEKHKKLFFKGIIRRMPKLAQQMQKKIKLSTKKAEKATKAAATKAKKDAKIAARKTVVIIKKKRATSS